MGAFGGRDPRVLWAGVDAGEPLDALYRAHDRAARAAGLEPEGRTFKPHVTLARMRGARQHAVARFLEENGALRTEPFTATRFVLLSARPGTGGGPYVVEAEFPFEGVEWWTRQASGEVPGFPPVAGMTSGGDERVAQHADAGDLDLDHVAGLQVRRGAVRAHPDDVAGVEGEVAGDRG